MNKKAALCLALLCLTPLPSYAEGAPAAPASQAEIKLTFAPLVKKVSPSVVNIYTKRHVTQQVSPFANDPLFSQFFGRQFAIPQERLESSLGSGVIIESKGLVVTNAHVVRGAEEITVALKDGREFPATVKLRDDASDVALVQMDTTESLPSVTLQPSETLEVGDLVIAIGNPFGVGQTVTSGIVSALARSSLSINDINFFIQTDAAINPGNSGGPLVSVNGGVVGINSAIYSQDGGSLGIGFAIPSEMVASVIAAYKAGQVTENGQIRRPWIGMTAQDLTSDIASSLGLAPSSGALVSALHEKSPAKAAGVAVGDVITTVDGHKIRDAAELRFRLATIALGETTELGIIRKGETVTASMKLIAPPENPPRATQVISSNTPMNGATIMNLNPAVEIELGLKNAPLQGVVVSALKNGSVAARFLNIGDVLLEVNGVKMSSVKTVEPALAKPTAKGWVFRILSGGQERTLMVR